MGKPFGPLPAPGARPFIVEVRRGAQGESRHPVIAAVVDADMGVSLLGQSFLSKLDAVNVEGDTMTLR